MTGASEDGGTGTPSETPSQIHEQDYPTLASWLKDADPTHPWKQLLAVPVLPGVTRPTMADMTLKPLEVMAFVVDAAQPAGLRTFIKGRFCDADPTNTVSARLELLCAFYLAARDIPFGFGGVGEADLVWYRGTDKEGWLEVTRAALDDFDRLRDAIEPETIAENVILDFHLDEWPMSISNRNGVHSRLSALIKSVAQTGTPSGVNLPEFASGATVSCHSGPPMGLSRISILHHTLDAPPGYLDVVGRKLERLIEEKSSQARKGSWSSSTVLLIDISSARYGQLLGLEGLQSWFSHVSIDWDDSPYAGVAVVYTHLHGIPINGVCRLRASLAGTDLPLVSSAISEFGPVVVQDRTEPTRGSAW